MSRRIRCRHSSPTCTRSSLVCPTFCGSRESSCRGLPVFRPGEGSGLGAGQRITAGRRRAAMLPQSRYPRSAIDRLPAGKGSSLNGLDRSLMRPWVSLGLMFLPPFELPAAMQFHRNLPLSRSATTSLPLLCQFLGERDTAALLQHHCLKATEQG
jgi:hypothetical protein